MMQQNSKNKTILRIRMLVNTSPGQVYSKITCQNDVVLWRPRWHLTWMWQCKKCKYGVNYMLDASMSKCLLADRTVKRTWQRRWLRTFKANVVQGDQSMDRSLLETKLQTPHNIMFADPSCLMTDSKGTRSLPYPILLSFNHSCESCGRKLECQEETCTEEMVRHQPTYTTGDILVELFRTS